MNQVINKNLIKTLGLTHFLETVFSENENSEKKISLQHYFQFTNTEQLLFDLSSIVVAPLYYQIKASEHLLECMVEAFSGLVYWFSQQDKEKSKAFENSIHFLGQFALRQGEALTSPFLNTLGFLGQILVAAYHFIKNPPITAVAGFFKKLPSKVAGEINQNWESISESFFNSGMATK